MATENYGVGPSAEKMNVGLPHSQVSRMEPTGKVVDKDGETVFDPETDGLKVRTDDPDIDYADEVGLPAEEEE